MNNFIFFWIFIMSACSWANEKPMKSILELSSMADFQCMDLRPLGLCPKPNRQPPIGVKVRYWEPEVFVETVKMPGDYVIREYGSALYSLVKNIAQNEMELSTGIKPLPVTSGSSSNALSRSNLHFNEVHLYDFPLGSFLDVVLCSQNPNTTLGIRYLSEMDSVAWREGVIEKNLPQSLLAPLIGPRCSVLPLGAEGQCMKSWGPLYPRTGFMVMPSEPVSSIVDGLRSISIAGNSLSFHIVESKLDFQINIPIDKVQMVYPYKTSCFPIGRNPMQWEQQSKDGRYVWIYWHQRQCCV